MRNVTASLLFTLCIVSTAQAGYRVSTGTNSFELSDIVGFSGQIIVGSSTSWSLHSAFGFGSSTVPLATTSDVQIKQGFWVGDQTFNASAVARVFRFGNAELVIPANALARDYLLFTSTSPLSAPIRVDPNVVARATQRVQQAGGLVTPLNDRAWEIFVQNDAGDPQSGQLSRPAQLSLPFVDANRDGIVDNTLPPVRVKSLSIWWLDEARSLWVRVPNTTVNTASSTVSSPIQHFSIYTVMGAPYFDPSDVYAFPSPWRPAGPNAGTGAGRTGTLAGGITFTNMPDAATIEIFTLAGRLVRSIPHDTGLQRSWDGKSDDGEDVASGTYIWVVESQSRRKNGKLAVIR